MTEIRYAVGLADEVARPLIRFELEGGGHQEALLPAAACGVGVWIGRPPKGTRAVWISPTMRPGPFHFDIKSVRAAPSTARLKRALASPRQAFFAAAARIVGLSAEADLNLRWVYGRGRALSPVPPLAEPKALQVALPDGADPARFVVVVHSKGALDDLKTTYESLAAQGLQRWRLMVAEATDEDANWLQTLNDWRAKRLDTGGSRTFAPDVYVAHLSAGDRLVPNAFSSLEAHLERRPTDTIVYTDEVRLTPGAHAALVFKPDWSPTREAWAPYVGRAAFLRADVAGLLVGGSSAAACDIHAALLRAEPNTVGHIRRPLIATAMPQGAPARRASATPAVTRSIHPSVGIVIPTRDRIDLLEPCLKSVIEMTSYPNFKTLVIDNDSVEPRTSAALGRLRREFRHLSVAPFPGAFNFSAICNFGARQIASDFLVFLNNDTEILQADWLDNLLEFAIAPDIGAVGAKLLYPDGRVQHAGVVLGLGGVAGHFGAGKPDDEPGWLGKDAAPHETSAVTGACLMIERRKFDVVGGFDAANLPIELNDIDLCLRLNQEGWRTICDCRTRLRHHQSASRGGGGLRLQHVYERERAYFLEKWRVAIRDDPYFNPNLSLYDYEPRLG